MNCDHLYHDGFPSVYPEWVYGVCEILHVANPNCEGCPHATYERGLAFAERKRAEKEEKEEKEALKAARRAQKEQAFQERLAARRRAAKASAPQTDRGEG